jgi:hypothetical protein
MTNLTIRIGGTVGGLTSTGKHYLGMLMAVLAIAPCATRSLLAQTTVVLHGRAVDSAGIGVNSVVVVRSASDNAVEIGRAVGAADGSFQVTLPKLPTRVVVEASTSTGLVGRIEIDSLGVIGSSDRPIIIHLRRPQALAPIQVRAHFQRRPSVFGFFEGEPSTRLESAGPATTDWFDPFSAGGVGALLRSSPDLLVTADGGGSVMGAPSSSNQVQIGGVQVPSGLVSGQLNGNIAVSPWDVTIGGAAGATVNLFQGPAGGYRTSYITLRSGVGGVPGWIGSGGQAAGVSVPALVSGGATGPLGRFGYRANVFLKRDVTGLPRWDRTFDDLQRGVLDSLSAVLGAPTIRANERNVQGGVIGRLDLFPFDNKRVLALTSALTRSTRSGGARNGYLTGSVGSDFVEDVALLQLESTRVLGERVLWTSLLSTSWTESDVDQVSSAPTIIVTDPTQNVFIAGGSSPQPTSSVIAAEARSTASWYSVDNSARYVAQLQTRLERAHIGTKAPHGTFTTASIDALRNGQAISLIRESGSAAATANSIILAPAASARFDLGKTGSLLLGVRADAWATSGVATSGAMRYVDVSPRVALLRRLGARTANRGPVATLRVGAGRFTDWPSVGQWSDAWRGSGATRELCAGANVPAIVLTDEAPACAGGGTIQVIGRPIAGSELRPTAANRADVSVAIAEIAPGVRAEFGGALAQNSRMSARLSPLANAPVLDRLVGEGSRALLVHEATITSDGIVPVAPIPSGISDATRLVSDARSTAVQWRVRLATQDPFARTKLSVAYTLTAGRERSLTIASPTRPPTFVSGPLAAGGRHSLAFSVSEWIGDAEVRFAGMARSGMRFTPLADRDLNGDGRVNDAAFVPQAESEIWASLVSPNGRSCVRAAAGRIAGVSSCAGPWTVSSLLLASIPGVHFGLRFGSSVDVQISNPLGAVVRTNGQRVTFGDGAAVDPILVHVTGFDSTAHRFRGEPLRGFGAPIGLSSGISDPVRLAVSVRIPLGTSVTSQRADAALRAMQRDTSARGRQGAALQYLGDLPPFPILVLQSGEGIQLTAAQRGTLQALAGRWQSSAARIVTNAVTNNGPTADASTPRERLVRARATFLVEAAAIAREIRQLLSADQIDLLPEGVQRLLNPRFLHFLVGQDAATF